MVHEAFAVVPRHHDQGVRGQSLGVDLGEESADGVVHLPDLGVVAGDRRRELGRVRIARDKIEQVSAQPYVRAVMELHVGH